MNLEKNKNLLKANKNRVILGKNQKKILILLLEREKLITSDIVYLLGTENAISGLLRLTKRGFLFRNEKFIGDNITHNQQQYEYQLSPLGKKYALILKSQNEICLEINHNKSTIPRNVRLGSSQVKILELLLKKSNLFSSDFIAIFNKLKSKSGITSPLHRLFKRGYISREKVHSPRNKYNKYQYRYKITKLGETAISYYQERKKISKNKKNDSAKV